MLKSPEGFHRNGTANSHSPDHGYVFCDISFLSLITSNGFLFNEQLPSGFSNTDGEIANQYDFRIFFTGNDSDGFNEDGLMEFSRVWNKI